LASLILYSLAFLIGCNSLLSINFETLIKQAIPMAGNEEVYLRQCLERNICPVCQQTITKKFGSSQFKDGVSCSLNCYTEWSKTLLIRRHQDKLQKDKTDE